MRRDINQAGRPKRRPELPHRCSRFRDAQRLLPVEESSRKPRIENHAAEQVMLAQKCRLTLQFQGQLLGITQRTIHVIYEHSGGRFSPRKLIPVNPKTVGDHLLLKRFKHTIHFSSNTC
jgi:hypothetical protein